MSSITRFAVAVGALVAASALTPSTASAQAACFYEHAGFAGRQFCVNPGRVVNNLPFGLNDSFSSVEIADGYVVTVCEHAFFEGRCLRLRRSVSNFEGIGFNDVVSSFRVSSRPAW